MNLEVLAEKSDKPLPLFSLVESEFVCTRYNQKKVDRIENIAQLIESTFLTNLISNKFLADIFDISTKKI